MQKNRDVIINKLIDIFSIRGQMSFPLQNFDKDKLHFEVSCQISDFFKEKENQLKTQILQQIFLELFQIKEKQMEIRKTSNIISKYEELKQQLHEIKILGLTDNIYLAKFDLKIQELKIQLAHLKAQLEQDLFDFLKKRNLSMVELDNFFSQVSLSDFFVDFYIFFLDDSLLHSLYEKKLQIFISTLGLDSLTKSPFLREVEEKAKILQSKINIPFPTLNFSAEKILNGDWSFGLSAHIPDLKFPLAYRKDYIKNIFLKKKKHIIEDLLYAKQRSNMAVEKLLYVQLENIKNYIRNKKKIINLLKQSIFSDEKQDFIGDLRELFEETNELINLKMKKLHLQLKIKSQKIKQIFMTP